jgi:hypothetical protein
MSFINPIHTETADEMWESLHNRIAFGPKEKLSVVTSSSVQLHNVYAGVDSFEWNNDLKTWWVSPARWNTLVRQYLNPATLDTYLDAIERKLYLGKPGVAVMRTNHIGARSNKGASWRTWGACILSVSYRSKPKPQITLHSRACYMAFLAVCDVSLAHVIGKLIGERIGVAVEDMSFVWHLESAQFHPYKSMPYYLQDPTFKKQLLNPNIDVDTVPYPALRNAMKTVDMFYGKDDDGVLYGDERFSQTQRARKRFHTEAHGYDYGLPFVGGEFLPPSHRNRFKPLPSTPTSTLTFDALYKDNLRNAQDDPETLVEVVDD